MRTSETKCVPGTCTSMAGVLHSVLGVAQLLQCIEFGCNSSGDFVSPMAMLYIWTC